MKLYDKYFGIEFVKVFLFALIGFVLLFTVFNILEILKVESNQDKIHAYLHVLYLMPRIISHVVPASLLFGVSFSVAQFSVSREIVAIQSAGVSYYRSILPVFLIGIFMSVFLFFFQNFIVTQSNLSAQNEINLYKKNTGIVKDLVWQKNLRGKNGYYFVYYFDKEVRIIKGGFNYLELNKNREPIRMIKATRAIYNENSKEWTLENVEVVNILDSMRNAKVDKYKNYNIKFPDDITFFENPSREPEELNLLELLAEVQRRKEMGFDYLPYEVQFYSGISYPLMCLIVTIVGALVGGASKLRSSGPLVRSILVSTVVMFLYTFLFNLSNNMGNSGALPAVLAGSGPTLIFLAVCGILLKINEK